MLIQGIKGAKRMDAYLKDQSDFTGVKAAYCRAKYWSFSETIVVIFLGQIHELPGGSREGQETPLEVFNAKSGRSWLDFDRSE